MGYSVYNSQTKTWGTRYREYELHYGSTIEGKYVRHTQIMEVNRSDPRYDPVKHALTVPNAIDVPRVVQTPVADPLTIDLTVTNSDATVRHYQAGLLAQQGYCGPINAGEARALANALKELGFPECVRRGWTLHRKTMQVPMSRYNAWRWRTSNPGATNPAPKISRQCDVLQRCYLFRSPMPTVPFEKFIKLARFYKDNKTGLRQAVKAVLDNPDAHTELETIDAIDALSTLTGGL